MTSSFEKFIRYQWVSLRKRDLLMCALLGLCIILATGCRSSKHSAGTSSDVSPVPAVTVKDLEGNPLALSSTTGKVVVINFWATWCGPCRMEIPDLAKIHSTYKDQGLLILGFAVDSGSANEIARAARGFGITYPVYIADDVQAQFKTGEILPVTFIINRKGRIVSKLIGLQEREQFENAILPLLKEAA